MNNNANQIELAEPLRKYLEKTEAEREERRRRREAERRLIEKAVRSLASERDDFTLEDVAREARLPLATVESHERFVRDLAYHLRPA